MRPISFSLVVNDFGVKYVNKDDLEHLMTSLQSTYKLTSDWAGDLYCGITLGWDYDKQYVDISMLGYIKKKLQKYGHVVPNRIQSCPYAPEPKQFGTTTQAPAPPNDTPKLNNAGIKWVKKIVGSILYFARTMDMTVLMALSSIAMEQTKATDPKLERCVQLLDYLVSNNPAKVNEHTFQRIVPFSSESAEPYMRTFFMGLIPKDKEPIVLNGAFHTSTTVMQFIMASAAAEAKLGALFHNCQTAITF
jgi:hypothetical protein